MIESDLFLLTIVFVIIKSMSKGTRKRQTNIGIVLAAGPAAIS